MANILSIGQTALTAAQVGLNTTGHNIANANTAGYNRQVMVQGSAPSEQTGFGFVGKGTQVMTVTRVYNEYLANQVLNSQTSQNALSTYHSQIKQINNMFADSTTGIAPAVQEFFKGVQNLAADPASGAARQSMLSSAQSLTGQFEDVSARLGEMRQGINSDITASIESINSIAQQIARLNNTISTVQAGNSGQPANDLLDQRDKLVSDLSKEIQVTVVKQDNDYNIFVGNGQSLVVSGKTFSLTPVASATDLGRIQVGYKNDNTTITLAEGSLTGGKLGGLLDFRSQTLDQVQNSLGRVAIGLGTAFNAQHQLGQDLTGALGGNFFRIGSPAAAASTNNTGTAQVAATISDASALTTSDYRFEYIGPGDYRVTRNSDGAITSSATLPLAVDGLNFNVASGTLAAGDIFLVKPTANGAAGFGVTIADTSKIAAAAPIRTSAQSTNAGSGKISAGSISSAYTAATVAPPVTLAFDATAGELTGFPAMPVTVTSNGTATVYAAGAPVPYTDGATISFGGASFTLSGSPADGDVFKIGPNTGGVGDNRNALLLGSLQTAKTLGNGTISFQSAFGQMVNMVGNKTHEIDVNQTAESAMLNQAITAQQSDSGVNLDEEAANLMRYQQAYQAAGKVMQTASKLFDVLLSLGQ